MAARMELLLVALTVFLMELTMAVRLDNWKVRLMADLLVVE